jgi:hypothetical protein
LSATEESCTTGPDDCVTEPVIRSCHAFAEQAAVVDLKTGLVGSQRARVIDNRSSIPAKRTTQACANGLAFSVRIARDRRVARTQSTKAGVLDEWTEVAVDIARDAEFGARGLLIQID